MKVYAVACWDQYYPVADNVRKVFYNDRDAYLYLDQIRLEHREKNSEYNRYDVFVYDVEMMNEIHNRREA